MKRLALQQPSDLFRLLTRERDRRRTDVVSTAFLTSPFRLTELPRVARGAHDAHAYT